MDREIVASWLNNYVKAWKTYDPQSIGDLFTEDAEYYYDPFHEPVRGREAIVASWLEEPDEPGTYDAHYEPVAVDGNVAVAKGRSLYFGEDHSTIANEYSNIFLLRFDEAGRCSEYREWYMEKPKAE